MLPCLCQSDFLPGWMCRHARSLLDTSTRICTSMHSHPNTKHSLLPHRPCWKAACFQKLCALLSVFTAGLKKGLENRAQPFWRSKNKAENQKSTNIDLSKSCQEGPTLGWKYFEVWVHLSNDLRSFGCTLLVLLSLRDKQSLLQALGTTLHNCWEQIKKVQMCRNSGTSCSLKNPQVNSWNTKSFWMRVFLLALFF